MQERTKNNKSIFTKIVFVLLMSIIFFGFYQTNVNAANTGQFEYDPSTKILVIKSNFTDDDMYKLSGLDNLVEKVVFNEGVTEISSNMFEDFTELKQVEISSTVKTIEIAAFNSCTSLEYIRIPSNVTKICLGAFNDCQNLKNVIILNNNIEIEKNSSNVYAFDTKYNPTIFCNANSKAYNYAKGIFPVKIIQSEKYDNKTEMILTKENELYIFANGDVNVGEPFSDYTSKIENIYIENQGKSWEISNYYKLLAPYTKFKHLEIKNATFNNNGIKYTGSMKIWDISGDKSVFAILINDEILAIADAKVDETVEMPSVDKLPVEIDKTKIKKVVITDGITTISNDMFEDFENIKSVIISGSVTEIGAKAFMNCSSLENILIPANVRFIGDSAFGGCEKLRDIVMLSQSITLGQNVSPFSGINLSKVTAYYKIYNKAFNECNKKEISYATNAIASDIEDNIIFVVSKDGKTLYILSDGMVKDYSSISNYKDNIETLIIGKNITSIGELASSSTLPKLKEIHGYYNDYTKSLFNQIDSVHLSWQTKYIYTIEYYANGRLIDTQDIMNSEKLKSFSEKMNSSYKPSNEYTFAGWTTNPNVAKLEYADGATIPNLENNIKLYDIWSRDANFYSGLDGKTNNKVTQYYNRKSYYLNLNDAKAKQENDFEKFGWRVDDVAASSAYFNGAYTQDDKDFYCVYKKNINFYYGKDKNTSETGTLYYNVKNGNYYLKTLGNSSKQGATINGWTLVGWTTNSQYTGKPQYTLNTELRNKDFSFNNNQTIEFYAIYKRNDRIKIIYNSGEGAFGSIDMYSEDQYYTTNRGVTGISTKFADSSPYTKDGYIFDYWTKNNETTKYNPNDKLDFFPEINSDNICIIKANWREPNEYTMTYLMNDGTNKAFKTQKVKENQAVTPINDIPKREGWIFLGWSTQPFDGASFWRGELSANKNLTLYAKWSKNDTNDTSVSKYEVKLNLNAPGSHKESEISFANTKYQIKLSNEDLNLSNLKPSLTGYTFKGWAKDKSKPTIINKYTENESTTLYAIWEAKTVRVTFMKNDGTNTSDEQTFTYDVDHNKATFSEKNWIREGYTQGRWYTTEECDTDPNYPILEKVQNSFIARNADKGITLYASWSENTATINYYGNDADTNKKKTDSNGKSEVTTVFNMQGSVSTNDPKWKWNLTDVSTLFEKNGYHITDNANAWIIDSAVKNGQDITDLKGKVIDQGNCYNETTGEFNLDVARNIIKEQLKTGSIEINLKANWQENAVTLKFHPEGGTVTTNGKTRLKTWTDDTYTTCTQTIKYTHKNASDFDMYNVTTLFAKEGYHITNGSYPDGGTAQPNDDPKAWIWRKADGSEQVVNQKSFNCKELMEKGSVELDLYPNWQANTATISYYANGGISANEAKYPITNGKSNVTNTFGINGNLNSNSEGLKWNIYEVLTLFKRPGYHIKDNASAWKVGEGDSQKYMDQSESQDQAKKDLQNELKTKTGLEVNLYANWIPNKYTIKFDANGGKGTMNDEKFNYDQVFNLPSCQFTNAGYDFCGWTLKKDDATSVKKVGTSVRGLTDVNNGVVTLYAYWIENRPLKVCYNVNGGTLSVGENGKDILSANPNKDGWILDKEGNILYSEFKKDATDINFPDVNNKKNIYLTREGYNIPENQEWIVEGKDVTYDQNTTYEDYSYSYYDLIKNATEVKDEDGKVTHYELKLKANWKAKEDGKVTLSSTTLNIEKGKTETLTATIEPADVLDKTITWTSSDEKIATVDENGTVTAVGAGEATITARVGIIEATCKVTVKEKTIEVTVKEDAEKVKEIKDIKEVVNDQEIIRKYIIVEPKTKAKEVIEELIINDERKLVVKNEKSDTVDETATVKTNERVTVEGDATVNIIIIVIGDVDSNGQVNFRDVIKLNNYRLKKDINEKNWNTAQKLAYKASRDITNLTDDKIEKLNFKDIIYLNNYRLRLKQKQK